MHSGLDWTASGKGQDLLTGGQQGSGLMIRWIKKGKG